MNKFSPRRLVRPIRLAFLVLAGFLLIVLVRSCDVVRIPEGESPLLEYVSGQRVVVVELDEGRQIAPGDGVVYARPEGGLALGRFVARSGALLEISADDRRVKVMGDATWYVLPSGVIGLLPLSEGLVLVLAENPGASDAGGVIPEESVVARVLFGLPL